MNIHELREIVELCQFDAYSIEVHEAENRTVYLQANYLDADIVTGTKERQATRKWLLSPHMTKSEVVQTAFKCCLTSMEHRARELFKYRGKRIFGPHFDVDALHEICVAGKFDCRDKP